MLGAVADDVHCGVHPHSRGENSTLTVGRQPEYGSSPLARGKLGGGTLLALLLGFIPTRAGKMLRSLLMPRLLRGSSPLARGKSARPSLPYPVMRFIPTRAGKIQGRSGTRHPGSVHPHSRGENSSVTWSLLSPLGSSPLARGKWLRSGETRTLIGFIPTRAGKMVCRGEGTTGRAVHPHSRGENNR